MPPSKAADGSALVRRTMSALSARLGGWTRQEIARSQREIFATLRDAAAHGGQRAWRFSIPSATRPPARAAAWKMMTILRQPNASRSRSRRLAFRRSSLDKQTSTLDPGYRDMNLTRSWQRIPVGHYHRRRRRLLFVFFSSRASGPAVTPGRRTSARDLRTQTQNDGPDGTVHEVGFRRQRRRRLRLAGL